MRSVLFRLFIACSVTCVWYLDASANPTEMEAFCRIYGMNCPVGGGFKSLHKTTSPLQASDRDFTYSDPANWSPAFYPQGLSESAVGLLAEGDSIYAAGMAGHADSIRTWGLALWDGKNWTSPVTRPPFTVRWINQVFKSKGKIHFCGSYSGEIPENRFLASWNGRDWETRALPIRDMLLSMTEWNGRLVLAPYMDGLWLAEDSLVTRFHPPIEGRILEVTVQGDRLWVRGSLNLPGDTTVHGVAYLEGGAWKVPGPIQSRAGVDWAWLGQDAFVIDGNSIFFPELVPTAVLRWNGIEWSRISVDPSAGLPRLLASDGQNLYLIGTDRLIVDNSGPAEEGLRISKWDGQKFALVDRKAFQGRVGPAKAVAGRLILAGTFQKIGDVRADNLAGWDGNAWTPISRQLGPGLAVPGSAVLSWGDRLIVAGGGITMAGKVPVTNIAAWSEAGWNALGSGIRAQEKIPPESSIPELKVEIRSLAAQNGKLYAAGAFDTAGTRSVRNIAQWDGTEWSPMGEGLPFVVDEVSADGQEVYALSELRGAYVGGVARQVRDVAHWNGSAWNSLGALPTGPNSNSMVHFNGAVWMSSADSLVKWNGTGWESLDIGLKNIFSLIVHKDALYLYATPWKLYKLEGGALDTLPNVTYPDKFASDGEDLFVQGRFDLPGFANTTLARWNGKGWIPMADLNTEVDRMVVHGDYLYLIMERPDTPGAGSHYYLRWNRKTGTWNQADKMTAGREQRHWKALPCIRDCYLSEREANRGIYDVRGRNLKRQAGFKRAAGVKVGWQPPVRR